MFSPNQQGEQIETLLTEDEETGMDESTSGFHLIDTQDDHVWLEFGTHHHDEWYPSFLFRYHPKKV